MPDTSRSWLARLTAFSTLFCMVAVVLAGFASAQARVHNFEHQAVGDRLLADGGWMVSCSETSASCHGHLTSGEPTAGDRLAVHHHHHNGSEVSQGLAAGGASGAFVLNMVLIDLRPGVEHPLVDLTPDLPFQPPRA